VGPRARTFAETAELPQTNIGMEDRREEEEEENERESNPK
jgi:hypothetical protein